MDRLFGKPESNKVGDLEGSVEEVEEEVGETTSLLRSET